jgi:glucokinase
MKYTIGVDLGGTHIKAGLVKDKKVVKRVLFKTNSSTKQDILKGITDAIEKVKIKPVQGIGIGVPGIIDYKKGEAIKLTNLPIKNFKIKKFFEKKFKVPVFLDNDASCFVLGEALYGSGKNKDVVIGLTLGTGVGGGVVINKKIFHGLFNAGELGHMSIKHDGIKCICGNFGCIEQYAGKHGIMRSAKKLNVKNTRDIYKLALKGNKEAIRVFEKTGFYLGVAITNLIAAFDPDVIVIGGGISNSWEFFSKSMIQTVDQRSFVNKKPRIVKRKLKDSAILGAASLVRL